MPSVQQEHGLIEYQELKSRWHEDRQDYATPRALCNESGMEAQQVTIQPCLDADYICERVEPNSLIYVFITGNGAAGRNGRLVGLRSKRLGTLSAG